MEATLLLCDNAEAINGKLYVMGGGWSGLVTPLGSLDCALAVRLAAQWSEANTPHALAIELVTEDRKPVLDDDSKPVMVAGDFTVGRPPDHTPGDDLIACYAFKVRGVTVPAGAYCWTLSINGVQLASARFRVILKK